MAIDALTCQLKNQLLFTQRELMEYFSNKLKPYGFDHFSYARLLDDQQRIILSPIPEYTELSIKKEFYKIAFLGPIDAYVSGFFLNDFLDLGEIKPALAAHGVLTGCRIIKKHKNYVDHFHIGSSKCSSSLSHFFINNLDIFEAHIQEFYDLTTKLRSEYEQNPLIFPRGEEKSGIQIFASKQKNNFTEREYEIIKNIKLGLSNKRIARQLNVSTRTVEKHIENMFLKTQAHSRIELLTKAVKFR